MTSVQLKGLGKRKMAAFTDRAKRQGMSPEQYLKRLVEDDLATTATRTAEAPPAAPVRAFQEIMGPGEVVDEAEVDELVEKLRTRHFNRRVKG